MIVTAANELMRPIHDRMPVILTPVDYERWLDPGFLDAAALQALLRPFAAAPMEAYRVGTRVNNPQERWAGAPGARVGAARRVN